MNDFFINQSFFGKKYIIEYIIELKFTYIF